MEYIIILLKGQIDLVKRFDIDGRADATFLTDVMVSGQSSTINADLETQVQSLCTCLKWGNAEAHIRSEFLHLGAPDEMDAHFLESMVKGLCGKRLTAQAREYIDNTVKRSVDGTLAYSDVERCCFKCLVHVKKTLPDLTEAQEAMIGKSITDPPLDTVSMSIKEGDEEEEGDDVPLAAAGADADGAGGTGAHASGSRKGGSKKESLVASNKSHQSDSSTKGGRPSASSKPGASHEPNKRNFIKENAIKVSTIHNLHPHHAAALHGSGKAEDGLAEHDGLLKRGGSGDAYDHPSNHGSPTAARDGHGHGNSGSSSAIALRGEAASHGGITMAGGTLHVKDVLSGSHHGDMALGQDRGSHLVGAGGNKPKVTPNNLASQPKLSSQQRSSGYAKLQGSPTGAARKQREIESFQSAALPQSPEISPVIRPPPPGEVSASAAAGGSDTTTTHRIEARKTMFILQNIQRIKELENARKLEAQTGIPAKKLMATSMPTAGNNRPRLRAQSSGAIPTITTATGAGTGAGGRSSLAFAGTGAGAGAGASFSSSHEPVLSSGLARERAEAEMNQRLVFGRKDNLKNSHIEGTGWRETSMDEELGKANNIRGSVSKNNAAARAAGMMDDPIPYISSPEQGADSSEDEEDDEEDEDDEEEEDGDEEGEGEAGQEGTEAGGSSEEKGEEADDAMGDGGAAPSTGGVGKGNKKGKGKGKKGRKNHRMTMMEEMVPGAYRPKHAAQAKAAAAAVKEREEQEDAQAAREAAEREKIVVLDFANSHMEALDLRSISQLSSTYTRHFCPYPAFYLSLLLLLLLSLSHYT